jgi:apolipoprotein N-acyltransferase
MGQPAPRVGVALLSGLLLGLAFPSWHLWPVVWLALIPVFYLAATTTPWAGAKYFFLAGLAFHAIVLQWLLTNVYWAGGWAAWGYALLCVYMALYWALFGALVAWLTPRLPMPLRALAAGTLWAAMEFAQARMFTGFGWSALGYSQGPDFPFLQWAALGGVFVLGFLIVVFNALVAYAIVFPKGRWLQIAAALLLLAGVHGIGVMLIDEADYGPQPFRVGIVQSNFPLEMKWDREYTLEMVANAAEKSRLLAARKPVDLFVWPESLIMDPIDSTPILEEVTALTRDTQTPLFTGSVRLPNFNSSHLVLPSGEIAGHYDKIHLAPFGEYVPLSQVWPFIGKIVPAIGDMAAGGDPKVFEVGGRVFGPLICFEVLFPAMSEHLRRQGAEMLVVITNLGWFGRSNAIPEELEIARLRAVEARLPLVHAANTGISGVFDPWGRFTVVHEAFDAAGNYYSRPDVKPNHTIMNRLVGGLEVALPAPRPLPYGPTVFPWLAVIFTVVFVAAGLLRRPRGNL